MTDQRVALGTVQFGIPYGVANQAGQVSFEETMAILSEAQEAGIDTLDTAIGYGDSERRLGEIGVGQFRIVSKLPPLPADVTDVRTWVEESVTGSLKRLGLGRLYGLLLHQSADLLGRHGEALHAAMCELKIRGYVDRIGVSIYGPEQLNSLVGRFSLDLVQAPFNLLDRRLQTSGWLDRLRKNGVEVHVRSVFLQGLLLMVAEQRPAKFVRWDMLWQAWDGWLRETGLSALEACVGFVLRQPGIDRIVVGVDCVAQLKEILAAANSAWSPPPAALATDDVDLINPSRWNAL